MVNQLEALQNSWKQYDVEIGPPALAQDIVAFESKTRLYISDDLRIYFQCLNGTVEAYDDKFFSFYSLNYFKSVNNELGDWRGSPDYRNIVNTLPNSAECYVFADYMFHTFTYAIRLAKSDSPKEVYEVYAIYGDEFKRIANSFAEFLELYLRNCDLLYF